MGVGIKGMSELLKDLDRIEREFPQEVNKVTNTIGNALRGHIIKVTPVDTGELRRSIVFSNTGKYEVTVGTTKKYAPYVNYGTKRQKGQYFLEKGIDEFKDESLEKTLDYCIKKVLK